MPAFARDDKSRRIAQCTLESGKTEDLRTSKSEIKGLNELLIVLWPVLRSHLIRNRRVNDHDAEDLVQEFVKKKILEDNVLACFDSNRGTLRNLLIAALDNFVSNEFRRRAANKRQVERAVQLKADNHPAKSATPDQLETFGWGRELLTMILVRMETECWLNQRDAVWNVFRHRVLDPALNGAQPMRYADIGEPIGHSPSTSQNLLVTAKRMFCRLMRTVICQLGIADEDVDREVRDLLTCLAHPHAAHAVRKSKREW